MKRIARRKAPNDPGPFAFHEFLLERLPVASSVVLSCESCVLSHLTRSEAQDSLLRTQHCSRSYAPAPTLKFSVSRVVAFAPLKARSCAVQLAAPLCQACDESVRAGVIGHTPP